MKLIFRGVEYDYTPVPVEMREDAIAGKYRGAALKFRTKAAKVPVFQPALDLIYRGVTYKTGAAVQLNADNASVLKAPVELFYRGMHYSAGPTQVAAEVAPAPQRESVTEQIRELVMQGRHKAEQREQSVLERFEDAIS